jgi:NADH:ubiquinone oxidoreductase subunit F (NADH-binding)/Pyruvate/2-oxoacid:ferredoxin oxidoreductase delta subunit
MTESGHILEMLVSDAGKLSEMAAVQHQLLTREKIKLPVIYIGFGTCGIVAGARKTFQSIQNYLTDRMIDAEVIFTGCIGLCSIEPIVDIQLPGKTRVSFSQVTENNVTALLDDVFHNLAPADMAIGQYPNPKAKEWDGIPFFHEVPFFALQQRLVLEHCGIISPESIEEYIAHGGYKAFLKVIKNYTPSDLCEIIEQSQLRGRSGSGFLTGVKWKIALNTTADQKYMICNAEESDPGAFMDRNLMEGDPHRLIEGLAIASYAIGANQAFIYIRSEYKLAISRLQKTIVDAMEMGLLGHNIFKSGYSLHIKIRKGPGAFVCGEETALINSLEGKRGMPKTKPPFPSVSGLYSKPTVINNVETLANIPGIIQKGPQWFNSIGNEESKGTKIFSVTGKVKYTGLIEVPMGTTLKDIVFKIAGGIPNQKEFKALHLGGPSGCMISSEHIDLGIGYESMASINAILGSGGMLVLDQDTCIIDLLGFFMLFMSKQSCGKCIPCREGTKRMYKILNNIAKKPSEQNNNDPISRFKGAMQLENLANVMKDASLCGLGQNAPNPVVSSLKGFKHEFDEHLYERHCRANVCGELRHFFINVDACTGCSICAKKCPEDAIIGSPRNPYFIVQEKCTGCGICYQTCKFNAITAD